MRINLKPLSGQVIAITGASSGIGLITAKLAASRGAKVMLIARNGDALAAAVREITASNGLADHAVADVGVANEVSAAVAKTIERFGRIDTWVNNAGTAIYSKLKDTPAAEHEHLFRTNYFGVVNATLAALPYLERQGGALITVASVASDIPSPILGAYAASKHAVKGYIESLRMELIADGVPVSVTLIKPSGMDTPIAQHAARHIDGKAMIPPPVYDPKLVAEAILSAAVKPRRTLTVGGVGRAQALAGTHFAGIFARIGKVLIPTLSAPGPSSPGEASLFRTQDGGRERSSEQSGRSISLYTALQLHPIAKVVIGGVAAAGVAAAVVVWQRRKPGAVRRLWSRRWES